MNRKIILLIVGITLVGTGLFAFTSVEKLRKTDVNNLYSFVKVEKGNVEQVVNVNGTVVSVQDVDLKFQTNGVIEKINYEVGDSVKKGYTLANLNSKDQEIEVKQREAALAQVRASLNLVLAGANNEDIAVYKSRIENAKKTVKTTADSTMGDIKNSEARVVSAQINLRDARASLETLEKQNNIDLRIAYEGARRVLDSSVLTLEKTLDNINDVLSNEVVEDIFSVKNSQYKSESELKYFQVSESFKIISEKNKSVVDGDYKGIDDLLVETKVNLTQAQGLLDSVFNGLVATITSSSFSQASLEMYKANVNSLRAIINAAIVSVEGAEQKILAINSNYEAKIVNGEILINAAQSVLNQEISNRSSVKLKADAQNVQAENLLKVANDEFVSKTANPRDVDVAYLQAKVHEIAASVELARENFKKTIIVSPVDGEIVDIKFDVGESMNSSNDFIILSTREKKVEADIPEIEIGKTKIGDSVEISLDAFVNKIFKGKIISIDPVNTNIQGIIYYKADIVFGEAIDSETALPGMTADINILTGQRQAVLNLPVSALKNNDNKYYVQELENDKIVFKDVVIGLVGNERVEIVSGVSEGERVIDFLLKTK